MTPLHVALAIPHLGGGGAERSTLAIARGLLAKGHSVDLLLLRDKIVFNDEIPHGAHLVVLQRSRQVPLPPISRLARQLGLAGALFSRRRHLRYALAIGEYLDQKRPDVLMPTLPDAKIASLLALSFANARPVTVPIMRSELRNRSKRTRVLYRSLFKSVDHIVTVSFGVAENLSARCEIAEDRMTTIYDPAVSADLHVKAEESPDHPWFSVAGPPIILAAGRLSRVKDFPTLIRAFEIASSNRPLRLLILGEGSWRPRLERMIRRKGLDDIVSFPGWVNNPFAYMRRAALFVVSSKYEGLSMVLIEALACGCPCVSTDCPVGPTEVLDGGRVGPLVPVGDPAALAAAIANTLETPPDPAMLKDAAQRFTFHAAISKYEALLRRLTASPR